MAETVLFTLQGKDLLSPVFQKVASSGTRAYSNLSGTQDKLQSKMQGTTGAVDRLRRSFVKLPGSGTQNRLAGVRNKLTSIAQAAGLAVGAFAAFSGIRGLIKLGADLETSQANFAILTGSIEKGKKLFEQLTTFANRTPFGNEDINKASLLLLNFGVAQKEILPTMQQLGDISFVSELLSHVFSYVGPPYPSSPEPIGNQLINSVPFQGLFTNNQTPFAEVEVQSDGLQPFRLPIDPLLSLSGGNIKAATKNIGSNPTAH